MHHVLEGAHDGLFLTLRQHLVTAVTCGIGGEDEFIVIVQDDKPRLRVLAEIGKMMLGSFHC